jgi:surface polysaccharide O-acyltransferase-like enzyme
VYQPQMQKIHAKQCSGSPIQVDLIRTAAVLGVLLLHAANDLTSQTMSSLEIWRWCVVDVYQSIGRMGVPLFVMLTGALLLAPSKQNEELGTFFKKRFSRIGLPFIFWGVIYFIWDFYVENQPATQSFIIDGILTGPYFTFWYLYMLVGLYLVTPLLRVLVANASDKMLKYGFAVWFIGTALVPFIPFISSTVLGATYYLDANVFVIPQYIGYFVLGAYLVNVKVINRKLLAGLTALGITLTAVGTYIIAMTVGGGTTYFFQEYISPTMILSAVPLFLLLNSHKSKPVEIGVKPSWSRRIMHMISENTLPIFLFHMIVIYTLQQGILGVTLNGDVVNSIIGVPLMVLVTLAICLAVLVPLKKVPVLKKLIG